MTKNKNFKKIILVIVAILVVVAAFFIWLYTGKITDAKKVLYKATYLPAGFINLSPVSLTALTQRYDLLKSIQNNKVDLSDSKVRDFIFDKLISDTELQILAKARGIKVNNEEIDSLYSQMASELTGGDQKQLEKAISSYAGLDKQAFQNQVLRSYALNRGLKAWFYGQKDLNPQLYQTSERILTAAKSGEEFGSLAQKYSMDGATAVFNGDSGFVETNQLSIEIAKGLKGAKTDEVKQIAGFDGLHIVKILGMDNGGEGGAERVRLQHIFLEGMGFENWFTQATKQFKVIKLINHLAF